MKTKHVKIMLHKGMEDIKKTQIKFLGMKNTMWKNKTKHWMGLTELTPHSQVYTSLIPNVIPNSQVYPSEFEDIVIEIIQNETKRKKRLNKEKKKPEQQWSVRKLLGA